MPAQDGAVGPGKHASKQLVLDRRWRGIVSASPTRHIQLTSDQVEAIVHAAHEGGTESVVMLMPEPLTRQQLPPTALWAQRIREDADARLSLPLARGLLFLARLAESGPARLDDLAEELHLSPDVMSRYAHTLTLAGLIEREPNSSRYRMVQ